MGDRHDLTRRALVKAGLATAGGLLLPWQVQAEIASAADAASVDPYSGVVPLAFPIRSGQFGAISNNWHASRIGKLMPANHRNGKNRRAHDGMDVFPKSTASLPLVYAPFAGQVLAVCVFEGMTSTYEVSTLATPRQDYSKVVDGRTPRHGNHVWIRSTEAASEGYQIEYSHLQDETTIRALLAALRAANDLGEYLTVGVTTPIGVLGDTGNAAGSPQLHVEIHLPGTDTFTCTRCRPTKPLMTAINPYQSLITAASKL